ncbi:MAG: caspase family protein [bacterium]|nr:caspase family protein [bacterium]
MKSALCLVIAAFFLMCNSPKTPSINQNSGNSSSSNTSKDTTNNSENRQQSGSPSINNSAGVNKIALLVGINKYELAKNLKGCVNDVELMKELLKSKFGFPEGNIKTLFDDQATRAGILDSFQNHLLKNTKKGDIVVFYYSGHGAQIKNLDKNGSNEIDNLEEILVAHDFEDSPNKPFRGILDDEINGLLIQLSRKTDNVTFILDACNSAGASKSLEVVKNIQAKPRRFENIETFAVGTNNLRNEMAQFAFIAGCKANQFSYEMGVAPNGRPQGALTYFLVEELNRNGETLSYDDIMGNVRTHIKSRYPLQYPELFGTETNKAVFGVKDLTPVPHAKITKIDNGKFELNVGEVLGTTVGSEFEVYQPGTDLRSNSKVPIGKIRITKVFSSTSEAEVVGNHSISKINSLAIESRHSYGDLKVKVFLDGNWSGLSNILNGFSSLDFLEISSVKSNSDLILEASSSGVNCFLGYDLRTPKKVFNTDVSSGEMNEYIESWANWFSAIQINNPKSDLDVEVTIRKNTTPKGTKGILDLAKNIDHVFAEGDTIEIDIRNNGNEAVFLHVLDIIDVPRINRFCLTDFQDGTDQIPAGGIITLSATAGITGGVDRNKEVLKFIFSVNGDFNLNYLASDCDGENTKSITPVKKGSHDVKGWKVINKVIEVKK